MTNITALLTSVIATILQQSVEYYNTSFSITILHDALEHGEVSLALGQDDRFTGTSVSTRSKWPVGSITKTVTTIRALKMYEEGLLDIDAPVYTIVDPLIMRDNGTTLAGLFKDERVKQITSRQIMSMRSGVPDYDDQNLQTWTFAHPNEDKSPYDLLYEAAAKGLLCDPGTCGEYSTTGFNLMGLVIAAAEGKKSWLDLDQSTFLPTDAEYAKQMLFPKLGPCTPYLDEGMVHQYAMKYKRGVMKIDVDFFDMASCSCLNAWTGGNLAAPTTSLAHMVHDLAHGKLVNSTTVNTMKNFTVLSEKMHMVYGIGLMAFDFSSHPTSNRSEEGFLWGHFGMDYGSGGLSLHNDHFDISFGITQNSAMGMNCSADFHDMQFCYFNILCQTYRASVKAIHGQDIDVCQHMSEETGFAILERKLGFNGVSKDKIVCTWEDDVPVHA